MKRIKFMLLAIAMLLAAPALFTSCQEDAPEINYTINVSVINDFTKVVEAINNGSLKNEQAIQKLTEAIDKMNADQQTRLQAIIDVLNSVNSTLDTKLAAIEAAMKAQTLTLESKLALLETAISNQTLKQEEMADKLITAIDKMNADQQTKLQAIIDVLNSVNATLDTKLAAIEAAMKAQTLTLESKLALLETAIDNQTLKQEEMADKLVAAIDNLKGSMDEKMEAINAAINNVNTALQTKLAAIEAAIKAQTLSMEAKLDLLEQAIKALPDYTSQLEAIKTAIANLPDYGDKLSAIEAAIKGMPNYSDKFDAVVAALGEMKTQIEALGTGQTGIATQIAGVTAAINDLVDEVNSGNTDADAALAQIIQKLEDLKGSIGGGGTTPGGGETPSTMEYVDLGLPSGLKWAKCNLGASKPSDYGDYYAWGETAPKEDYDWATYKWMQAGQSDSKYITKYTIADGETEGIWYDSSGAFIGDNKTALDAADDAATANLGSPWRMPTTGEIQELIDKCTWAWTKQDGVDGYQVDGPNGNAIFLPAAGYNDGSVLEEAGSRGHYWSSSLSASGSDYALSFRFSSSGGIDYYSNFRYCGVPVRPVRP